MEALLLSIKHIYYEKAFVTSGCCFFFKMPFFALGKYTKFRR